MRHPETTPKFRGRVQDLYVYAILITDNNHRLHELKHNKIASLF